MPESQRPRARASATVAGAFDAILHDAWVSGDDRASNAAVARHMGIDEKQVRQYRDGRKRVALADVLTMPSWLATKMVAHTATQLLRDGSTRVAISLLRECISALDGRSLGIDDHASLMREQGRMVELLTSGAGR